MVRTPFTAVMALTLVACSLSYLPATAVNKTSAAPTKQQHPAKQEVAGLVLEVNGKWEAASGVKRVPLKKGDAVLNGGQLKQLTKDATITVVLTDGTRLKCPGCAGCKKPISVAKSDSPTNRWLAAAISMFVQKPNNWVVTESRPTAFVTGPTLQDAVVMIDVSGHIDMTPALSGGNGKYTVHISAANGPREELVATTQIELKKGKTPSLLVPELKAGLYRVEVLSNPDEAAPESWLLVCDENNYEQQQTLFQKATQEASTWKPDVQGTADVRELLRAYMACLSDK